MVCGHLESNQVLQTEGQNTGMAPLDGQDPEWARRPASQAWRAGLDPSGAGSGWGARSPGWEGAGAAGDDGDLLRTVFFVAPGTP